MPGRAFKVGVLQHKESQSGITQLLDEFAKSDSLTTLFAIKLPKISNCIKID